MPFFGGLISRLDTTKLRISKFEDTSIETSQTKKKKKDQIREVKEQNIQVMSMISKYICVMGIIEMRKEQEIFGVIVAEKFPELCFDSKTQAQEAQRILSRINTKKSISTHNILL